MPEQVQLNQTHLGFWNIGCWTQMGRKPQEELLWMDEKRSASVHWCRCSYFSTFQQSPPATRSDVHWWNVSCGGSWLRIEIHRTLRSHEPLTTPTLGCLQADPSSCQSKCGSLLLPLFFFSWQWKLANSRPPSCIWLEFSALIMFVGARNKIPARVRKKGKNELEQKQWMQVYKRQYVLVNHFIPQAKKKQEQHCLLNGGL